MALPALLTLADEAAYRAHFEREYCLGTIFTHDGIRVYFNKNKFDHAFFEKDFARGTKSHNLSIVRAERMDWIKTTLENPDSDCFQGWNKTTRSYEETRRVQVVYESFVVVIQVSLKQDGSLKANFITCYQADNSITKIRQSPNWDKDACLTTLEEK